MIDAPAWSEALWAVEARLAVPRAARHLPFTPLPDFPAVERDLALVLRDGRSAVEVERVIRGAARTELLESLSVFDRYEGKGLVEGARSIGWRLKFRHPERTLTDAEVDAAIDEILRALKTELDVERR